MTTEDPIAALRAWLIDQSAQAKVGAENPSGWSMGDTGAAFDSGARHMADATLTWLGEYVAALTPTTPALDEDLVTAAWRLYWNVTDAEGHRFIPDPTVLRMLRKELDAHAGTPGATGMSGHPPIVISVHEIGPFLRSLTKSGETLHEGDIAGIEVALREPPSVEALAEALPQHRTCTEDA